MKKNKKQRKGSFLLTVGSVMLLAAGLITANNLYMDKQAGESAKGIVSRITDSIEDYTSSVAENNQTDTANKINTDTSPSYVIAPDMEMPAVAIDGSRYVGILSVPSLNLELPVLENFSYDGLLYSPCRYSGSIYKDNLVIAAHNYQTHFGLIKELSSGDEITFTDADGNTFYFKVAYISILKPDDVEKMIDSECPLTLFTCNYSGFERVTVRCEKAE